MLTNKNENKVISINFGGEELIMSGLAHLYWPAKKMLILADLHLEKGSYFAKQGNPLPLYDSMDTLRRLKLAIDIFKPNKLLSLGDNIHDMAAFNRMPNETRELLKSISQNVEE